MKRGQITRTPVLEKRRLSGHIPKTDTVWVTW